MFKTLSDDYHDLLDIPPTDLRDIKVTSTAFRRNVGVFIGRSLTNLKKTLTQGIEAENYASQEANRIDDIRRRTGMGYLDAALAMARKSEDDWLEERQKKDQRKKKAERSEEEEEDDEDDEGDEG